MIVEETVTCDRRADQQGDSEASESQSIAALPSTSVTSAIQHTTSNDLPADGMPLPLNPQKDAPKDDK